MRRFCWQGPRLRQVILPRVAPETGERVAFLFLARMRFGLLANQIEACPDLRHFWARDYLSQEVQNLCDERASAASVPAKGNPQLSRPQETRSREWR